MKNLFKYQLILLVFFYVSIANIIATEWHEDYYTNRMTSDNENLIIAASKGIIKYNKANGTFYNASEEYFADKDSKIYSVLAGKDAFYYSDSYYGPYICNGEQARQYYMIEDNESYGYALAFDNSDNVWINYRGYFSHPETFDIFPINQNKVSLVIYPLISAITDMAFDSKNNLWLTATNGDSDYLSLFSTNTNNAKDIIKDSNCKISSVAVDNDDNVWFTTTDGIHCYSQVTEGDIIYNNTTNTKNIPNAWFYANDVDDDGNVWFTSSHYLLRYDGENFKSWNCYGYHEARSILCDGDIVWILLEDDRLLKFQNEEFETIDLSSAVTGIEENKTSKTDSKAYVANGVLNIETPEGINLVEVYDTTGKLIISVNGNGAVSKQIPIPNTKGVLIIKVNYDVLKVIL